MARDRILQALGRIDSALLRLETLPMPLAQAASALEPGDRAAAQEALAALDQLIADMKADHG